MIAASGCRVGGSLLDLHDEPRSICYNEHKLWKGSEGIMPKYVYLFELDSVRNSDKEIEIGQKALYEEIVGNGNIVVLTYNQLVDSKGFFNLLENEEYYENLVTLFEKGAICISQYGDIRTISQYLMDAFDYSKDFIFSGWPLKSTQRRLLALIKRCLMYSDLSEIYDYKSENKTENEILDLFIEVDKNGNVSETSFDKDECINILEKLYCLLKTVLRLSFIHTIYVSPKKTSEYENLKLSNIISCLQDFQCLNTNKEFSKALMIINQLPCVGSDKRSEYLLELLDYSNANSKIDKQTCQYAEAIINLAYNYACEISICNISKHYNVDELVNKQGAKPTFEADFMARLRQYWEIGELDKRFLVNETNDYSNITEPIKIPDFTKAVRIVEYTKQKMEDQPSDVLRYEFNLNKQQKKQKSLILSKIGKKILFSFGCFLIAFAVEVVFQIIQNGLDDRVEIGALWWIAIETLFFISATEIISTFFSKIVKKLFDIEFLSFAEALSEMGKLVTDAGTSLICKINTYTNNNCQSVTSVEEYSVGVPIDFISSSSLKKYMKFMTLNPGYFADSEVYPIALTDKKTETLKEIVRLEEMFDYHFGLQYSSKYNTLVVDPIISQSKTANKFFPYERIVPTYGNGVVMVTRHNDKLLMLRQFRHAPRKMQIAFPRGFGEKDILSVENAKKELSEEMCAKISSEPIFIGSIAPDSGLTSSCVSVYLVDVETYRKVNTEGILDVVAYSQKEIENLIHQNNKGQNIFFDDGFSLASYSLYKRYIAEER